MIIVVDASVAIKWFLDDPREEVHAGDATAILQGIDAGRVRMVQPPHFLAEVAAILTRVQPDTAEEDLLYLQLVVWEEVALPWIYTTAVELAIRLQLHPLDTLYHATALHSDGAVMVTADDTYFDKARGEGRISRLRDFSVPS